jgi:hypothetical protein
MHYGSNHWDRLYINIGEKNVRLRKFCQLHLLLPKIYIKLPLHVESSAIFQKDTWGNTDQKKNLKILV